MSSYIIFLPSYSIGEDCYNEIPNVIKKYGKKVVVIGGKTAIEKSKNELLNSIKDSDIEILDFIWYGGDSTYENVEILKNNQVVKKADLLFASRDKFMYHTPLMGICISKICTDPLIQYGKKAIDDCNNNVSSFELEQVALDIIVSTGIVSNFVTHEGQKDPKDNYYYNSSLAHCVYYGSSLIKACEKHLHGEIVSFGVLCLLTYDNQIEERDRIMKFNKSIGLPIILEDISLIEDDLNIIAKKATSSIEWSYIPGNPTEEKFINAIKETNKVGLSLYNIQ